ncbi:MAG TPA: peroxiredoxin-like family protein [Granulicella sp.]|jgi:peroxiredoxin|nr:peroxiredoxin-like family protein [Granulicella sp.]
MTRPNAGVTGSLQDRLDAITTNTRKLVQPARLAVSERAIEELFASGIEERVLKPGDAAPEFTLIDALTRKPVNSGDLLSLGPVVVNFFRGRWCPYCVTELESWREFVPEVRRRGGLFVAISPQTVRQNDFTLQQHALAFPLLSDPGASVAESFGVAYSVPRESRTYYQSILVNIPHNNAGLNYHSATEESWRLPLPATFVIGRDGRIAFAEAHADFRVRPEPAEVLCVLDSL